MIDTDVKNLSRETLAPIVAQLLDRPAVALTTWSITPIHGGFGNALGGTALYRLQGDTESKEAWSVVLKILYQRPQETADSPYYWKREYELYRSNFFDTLPQSSITTPEIYHCSDRGRTCWIWMEDIEERVAHWEIADFHLVARRLGRFNGAYLTGHPIPTHPWLTDQWHSSIIPPLAPFFAQLDDYLQHPLVKRVLPIADRDEILHIWQDRNYFREILADLPQTLCHFDAFRRNIFHSTQNSKLIDWALVGRGAVGEEMVCFIALAFFFSDLPLAQSGWLDQELFNSYLSGLRDTGWAGDATLARLGYTCAMTLRGLAGVKQDILFILDEEKWRPLQRQRGFDTAEALADFWAGVRRYRLLDMAKEAKALSGY